MYIIGWDIGIKNLAYCIIDKYDSTKDATYKKIINASNLDNSIKLKLQNKLEIFEFNDQKYIILDWEDINVVAKVSQNMADQGELYLSSRPKFKSSITNNKNKQCSKNAIYCKELVTNGKYFGYCNAHFLKSPYSRLPRIDEKKPICYWSCKDTDGKSIITCKTKAIFVGKDNNYINYCTKHKNEIVKSKTDSRTDSDFLKIKNIKKSTNINLTMIGQSLFEQLDAKHSNVLNVETILLENQPVLKNPTMKSVQMFMYSYYIMRGVQDKNKPVKEIHCYSASNKTDLDKHLTEAEQKEINTKIQSVKDASKKRKRQAEHLIGKIITTSCPTWFAYFDQHKKKDDLADSLLMTLHYLNKNKK